MPDLDAELGCSVGDRRERRLVGLFLVGPVTDDGPEPQKAGDIDVLRLDLRRNRVILADLANVDLDWQR